MCGLELTDLSSSAGFGHLLCGVGRVTCLPELPCQVTETVIMAASLIVAKVNRVYL